jgi:pimeloyl-ACP methyl ester carboxylesterase
VNSRRQVLRGTVVLAGTVASGALLLHRSTAVIKARANAQLDPLYDLPADVAHHEIASADGGSLHVLERGHGRPLVLIHGIGLQAAVWSPQLHLLADRYRVLAPDVRGHGRSRAGGDGFGRQVAARDLLTALEHFDLRDAVVVGHSMGGAILMRCAADFPDELGKRVAGLVFMDTAAFHLVPGLALPVARALGQIVIRRLERGRPVPQRRFGDDDLSWGAVRLAFGACPSGKAVDQVRRFLEDLPPSTTVPTGLDLVYHDERAALAHIPVPCLVLVGSRDMLTPVYAARRIAELVPAARLEIVPGAGHQLMQERPHEVAALLDDFVTELDPSPRLPA